MRKLLPVILVVVVGGLAILATGAGAAGGEADGVALAETCAGEIANIRAAGEEVIGTPGDDYVVLGPGAVYESGGGTDVICDKDGNVEAKIVPFDEPVLDHEP